jgi:hypothetical protein
MRYVLNGIGQMPFSIILILSLSKDARTAMPPSRTIARPDH